MFDDDFGGGGGSSGVDFGGSYDYGGGYSYGAGCGYQTSYDYDSFGNNQAHAEQVIAVYDDNADVNYDARADAVVGVEVGVSFDVAADNAGSGLANFATAQSVQALEEQEEPWVQVVNEAIAEQDRYLAQQAAEAASYVPSKSSGFFAKLGSLFSIKS